MLVRASSGSSGGGGNPEIISHNPNISSFDTDIRIYGELTCSTTINAGAVLFTITPAPSSDVTVTNALERKDQAGNYRNVTIKTNGDVQLDTTGIAATTWKVNIPLSYS